MNFFVLLNKRLYLGSFLSLMRDMLQHSHSCNPTCSPPKNDGIKFSEKESLLWPGRDVAKHRLRVCSALGKVLWVEPQYCKQHLGSDTEGKIVSMQMWPSPLCPECLQCVCSSAGVTKLSAAEVSHHACKIALFWEVVLLCVPGVFAG